MTAAEHAVSSWKAELALEFRRDGGRTILAKRRHDGPLVVQKTLYPEGEGVCHAIVVHPPGGIAGGDDLTVSASVAEGASALLTTPGAAKWYRSAGPWASQRVLFEIDGCLEWLPQETIVFDGALADLSTSIHLSEHARYIGWEIFCLGRTGSGERFTRGESRLHGEIRRAGKLLWLERGRIAGGGELLESPTGLQGRPVFGTMLVAAPGLSAEHVRRCRADSESALAITLLHDVLVARYLGQSGAEARRLFTQLWSILRPEIVGRNANEPRIWRT